MAEWIASDEALAQAVSSWPAVIGLDTEFIRTDTYYPLPGLYQVAAGQNTYLIDPLAIEQWDPFVDYLSDPETVKVMHACLEDLELLHHHLGVNQLNVFDTQFANAFVSEDFSLSYAGLVEQLLGVSLPKHATRSNWLKRPLSEEQLHYAVDDVNYLGELHEVLCARLQAHGRVEWFSREMWPRAAYAPVAPLEYYRSMKKAWQLKPAQLAVLRHLGGWRETTARTEDVPRNRVVRDEHLVDFARVGELELHHVRRALPRPVANRYGEPLIEAHAQGRQEQPPVPVDKPLSAAQNKLVKQLREVAVKKARELNLAPELLARKRDVEACVRFYDEQSSLSEHYQGWRAPLVGERFLDILQSSA